jgi:hypothetical protein
MYHRFNKKGIFPYICISLILFIIVCNQPLDTARDISTGTFLKSPFDKAMVENENVLLVWYKTPEVSEYNVQISEKKDFIPVLFDVQGQKDTMYKMTKLEKDKTYYWHVKNMGNNGTNDWSLTWQFTVKEVLCPLAVGKRWNYIDTIFSDIGIEVQKSKLAISGTMDVPYNGKIYETFFWNWYEPNLETIQDHKLLVKNEPEGFNLFGGVASTDSLFTKELWVKYPVSQNETWNHNDITYTEPDKQFSLGPLLSTDCMKRDTEIITPAGSFSCIVYHENSYLKNRTKNKSSSLSCHGIPKSVLNQLKHTPSYDIYYYFAPDMGYIGNMIYGNNKLLSKKILATMDTIVVIPPQPPILLSPLNGAAELNAPVKLVWKPVENVSSYHVQLSPQEDFSSVTFEQTNNIDTVATVTILDSKMLYYWRVRSRNTVATSVWSEKFNFTTKTLDSMQICPLTVGNCWNYSDTFYFPPDTEVERSRLLISGKMNVLYNGASVETFFWNWFDRELTQLNDEKWLMRNGPNGLNCYGGVCSNDTLVTKQLDLKFPVTINDTWTHDSVQYNSFTEEFEVGFPVTLVCTGKNKLFHTPAGTFSCIEYLEDISFTNDHDRALSHLSFRGVSGRVLDKIEKEFHTGTVSLYTYYAPNFGLVGSLFYFDDELFYKQTLIKTETILILPPKRPVLLSPYDGSSDVSCSPELSWDSVATADSYRVQVSSTDDFTTLISDDSTTTTLKTIGPLSPDSKYYWRVNATNKGGTGPWADVFGFITVPVAPDIPTLNSPANNATDRPLNPLLTWNAVSGAATYRAQLSKSASFTELIIDDSTLTSSFRTVGPLTTKTTYYWRVKAGNAGGTSAWSPVWNFTTVPPVPNVPVLRLPSDSAVDVALKPTFVWDSATRATSYDLQATTDTTSVKGENFESGSFSANRWILSGNVNWSVTTGDKYEGAYSARSGAIGNNQSSNIEIQLLCIAGNVSFYRKVSSETTYDKLTFYIDGVSPENWAGEIPWSQVSYSVSPGIHTFKWTYTKDGSTIGGSDAAWIDLISFPSNGIIAINQSGITATSFSDSVLSSNTKYFWKVRGVNAGGASAWSASWRFTTIPSAPGTPILSLPTNSVTNQPLNLSLFWNAVSGAATYRVQLSTVPSFATTVVDDSTLTVPTKAVGPLTTRTLYYWRVYAINSGGISAWSAVWRFTTIAPPVAPILRSPINNSSNQSLNLSLIWNMVSNASTYRVQLSTVSSFATTVVDDSTLTIPAMAVGPLSIGTTYYWRVNAKNEGGIGPWSEVRGFTTIPPIPAVPILTSPTNGAVSVSTSPTFTWNPSAGATTYDLQATTDTTSAKGDNFETGSFSANPWTLSGNVNWSVTNGDKYEGVYSARSGAITHSQLSSIEMQLSCFSGTVSFYRKVSSESGCDKLTFYIDGFSQSEWSGEISWSQVSYPVSPGMHTFKWVYAKDGSINIGSDAAWVDLISFPSNGIIVVNQTGLGANVFSATGLSANTKYLWKARAVNAGGASAWSGYWSFTTMAAIPDSPILSSPANGATNQPPGLSLTWNTVSNASTYRVQLSTTSSFATTVVDDSTLTVLTKAVGPLTAGTTYYWRVNAKSEGGTGAWSAYWSFTIIAPPAAPILSSPVNLSLNQPLNLPLTWYAVSNASTYRVQLSTASSFSPIVVDDSTLTVLTKAIGPLTGGTTYYWRVYAKNAGGISLWSEVRSFTTIPPLPAVPVLISPANDAVNISTSPTFTWNLSAGAVSYDLQATTDTTSAKGDNFESGSFSTNPWVLSGNVNWAVTSGDKYEGAYSARSGAITDNQTSSIEVQLLCIAGNVSFYRKVSSEATYDKLTFYIDGTAQANWAGEVSWSQVSYSVSPGTHIFKWTYSKDGGVTTGSDAAWVDLISFPSNGIMVVNQTGLTTTSFAASGLAVNTRYLWKARAVNAGGASAWSGYWSFTTMPVAPVAPSLISPVNGVQNQSLNPSLTWNAVTGATTYRVQLSTSSIFATILEDYPSLTVLTKTVGLLTVNTPYYWRVSATNAGGTSPWSVTWSFTTVPAPPIAPTLLSPTDGATDQSLNPTLTWGVVSGALTYHLQLSTSNTFTTTIVDDASLTVLTKEVGPLVIGTTYYWRVSATNAGGTGPWSSARSFITVPAPPIAPTLISPNQDATNQSLNPTLTWNPVAGATSYQLQLSTNSSFSTFVVNASLVATTMGVSSLTTNTLYYWRVSATNAGGTSVWSTVYQFTTVPAPATPTLLSPADLVTGQSLSPTLQWNAIPDATTYHLQLSTDSLFSTTVVDELSLTVLTKSVGPLTASTKYFWRTSATNAGGGTSAWPIPFRFTTGTAAMPYSEKNSSRERNVSGGLKPRM